MKILAISTAIIAVLGLAACGNGSESGKTTIVLGDQSNGLRTLAAASGAFDNTPYVIKWAEFQGAAPLFEAAKSGSVDTTFAADLPTLQAVSSGIDVKAVGALHSSGIGTLLVTQGNSTVRSIADLKGKDVVVSSARGSIAEYLLAKVLQDNGFQYSDVHVKYLLPTDAQAAFSSGKIDVWATFGVYGAKALQSGARKLADGTNGNTSGIGFFGATTTALADSAKKAAIADVLARLKKATAWGVVNKDAYAAAFVSANKVTIDVAKIVVAQGADAFLPVDESVRAKVQPVADLMHGIGSLKTAVIVRDLLDANVYQES